MDAFVDAEPPCDDSAREEHQEHGHGPQAGVFFGEFYGPVRRLHLPLDTSVVPVEELSSQGTPDDHSKPSGQVAQPERRLGQPGVHAGEGGGDGGHDGVVDGVHNAGERERYGNVGVHQDDERVD